MKLTVLADNNTYIDQYYLGEPAACYHIEDGAARVLLDTGYSDIFMSNAEKLGIKLGSVTHIALTHGHDDHTRGLKFMLDSVDTQNISVVAHPGIFTERYDGSGTSMGCPVNKARLEADSRLTLTETPFHITDRLVFLGEIPSSNNFERVDHVGFYKSESGLQKDFIADDSALAYKGDDGLFIITGCSHSGICNIVEHAKNVCRQKKIAGILGGFHLCGVTEQLNRTIEYFKKNNIDNLYPCHCVNFEAKAEIHKHIPIHEVGVGLTLTVR